MALAEGLETKELRAALTHAAAQLDNDWGREEIQKAMLHKPTPAQEKIRAALAHPKSYYEVEAEKLEAVAKAADNLWYKEGELQGVSVGIAPVPSPRWNDLIRARIELEQHRKGKPNGEKE